MFYSKTIKALIFIWLIILTILIIWLCNQIKDRPTNNNLLDVKDRVEILELDFEHNQGRVEEAIKKWFKHRRIVPVGRGVLLAVEAEKESG